MNLRNLKDLLQFIVDNRELRYWGRAILFTTFMYVLTQFN